MFSGANLIAQVLHGHVGMSVKVTVYSGIPEPILISIYTAIRKTTNAMQSLGRRHTKMVERDCDPDDPGAYTSIGPTYMIFGSVNHFNNYVSPANVLVQFSFVNCVKYEICIILNVSILLSPPKTIQNNSK